MIDRSQYPQVKPVANIWVKLHPGDPKPLAYVDEDGWVCHPYHWEFSLRGCIKTFHDHNNVCARDIRIGGVRPTPIQFYVEWL